MKKKTQSLSLLFGNYLLILKILPVTRFKDPKAAIFYTEIAYREAERAAFDSVKSYWKPPVTSKFQRIFTAAN